MNVWLQMLGAGSIGAIFLAVINGFFGRRKLSAEATQIITDAAGGLVQRLDDQVRDYDTRFKAVSADLDRERRERQQHERSTDERLAIHAAWDRGVVLEAQQQGFHLPPPPPLFSGEDSTVRPA